VSCEFAFDDGAYVLGALSPAERAAFEQHLAGCPACREAVAQLAVLPGLLRRLGPQEATQPLAESVDRLPRLIERVHMGRRKRARQRRLSTVSLVALCLALLAGMGITVLRGDHPHYAIWTNPPMVPMTQVAAHTEVTAEVAVREVEGGVEVAMHCLYPADGRNARPWTFRLVALGSDGATEQVGSWTAAPGQDVTLTGTTRFHLSDLVRLELRGHDGSPLLAYDLP
jgi:hypothetical protein